MSSLGTTGNGKTPHTFIAHTQNTAELTFVSPEKQYSYEFAILALQRYFPQTFRFYLQKYCIGLVIVSATSCIFPGPWRWCNVQAGAAYLYLNYLCKIQMAFSWQILSLQGNCSFPALKSLNWFLGNNESSNSTTIACCVSVNHLMDFIQPLISLIKEPQASTLLSTAI